MYGAIGYQQGLLALVLAVGLTACGGFDEQKSLASAKKHLEQRNFDAAELELKSVLQEVPSSGEARYLLGKALQESGDLAAAEGEFRKALDAKFRSDDLISSMARAMLGRGRHAKVVEEFGSVTLAGPIANAELQTTVADAHARTPGGGERAEAILSAVLQAQPDFVPARVMRARLLAIRSGADAALKELAAAGPAAANNADAAFLEGMLLLNGKQDLEGGVAALERTIKLKPDHLQAHTTLMSVRLFKRDLPGATQQVEALKKALPYSPYTKLAEGQMAYLNGQFPQARDILQALLRFMPDNLRALYLAGAVELELNSLVQAETYLSKAVALTPGLAPARLLLARTYLRTGQTNKALAALGPVLEATPPSAEALVLAAEAHLQSGDLSASELYFRKADKATPGNARIRTALALSELGRGNEAAGFNELQALAGSSKETVADLSLISARVQRGQIPAALEAIAALEAKQPDKPLAAYLRGRLLLSQRDLSGARASFDNALAKDPVYFPAIASLAAVDMLEKKPQDAQARLESVVKSQPRNVTAILALADQRVTQNAPVAEVVALIDKAIQANPSDTEAHIMLVGYHLHGKRNKAALDAAQKGIAALPKDPNMLTALGRAQLAVGEANQALNTFSQVAQLQPRNAEPHLLSAEAHVIGQKPDLAIRSLMRALELSPDNITAQRQLIQIELRQNRPDRAIAVARTVQRQRPDEATGFLLEGNIEIRRRQWDKAARALRAGLEKRRGQEVAPRLHYVLKTTEKSAEADRFAQDWLQKYPKDTGFLAYLGDLSLATGNWSGAEAHYRKVLEIDAKNAGSTNNLAWALTQQSKPEAVTMAQRAVDLDPASPAAYDTLATALESQRQPVKAAEAAAKSVSMAPDWAPYRLHWAKLLIDAGEKAKAKDQLDRLALLGSGFSGQAEVKRLLATL